jgi:hypothetical protein
MTAKERPAGGASGPKGQKFKSPASSLRQIAAGAQLLLIEHATTDDLPDGRQMPPLGHAGAPSVGSPAHGGAGSIHATRKNDELRRRRRRRLEQCDRAEKWRNTMDVSKYLGNAFHKVGDVKVNGPIRLVITSAAEGQFDKLDLTFDDGTRLSLNVTNTRALARAYGTDDADWIGKEIELTVGEIEYQGQAAGVDPRQADLAADREAAAAEAEG